MGVTLGFLFLFLFKKIHPCGLDLVVLRAWIFYSYII